MKFPKPPSNADPARQKGQVRIIGGLWKRSKLDVLPREGLRPTPDRVRETLFNWLGQDLSGWHCVDAFAGSGALGFEAASRGAVQVLIFEQDSALIAQLQSSKTRLKADSVRIERGDALTALKNLPAGSQDLIFLDPPFEKDLFLKAIEAAMPAIHAQGAIYLEAPRSWSNEQLLSLNLRITKQGKAGEVHFHLLQRV